MTGPTIPFSRLRLTGPGLHDAGTRIQRPVHRIAGFTLTDTMIAVLIIGILGTAALPRMADFLSSRRLAAAARYVADGLEYTGALSIRYQRPFLLAIDADRNRIQVKDTAPYPDATAAVRPGNTPPVNAADVVFNPASDAWYSNTLGEVPGLAGVEIRSAPQDITFYPDGHSGEQDSLVVLTLGEMSQTLRVDRITGRVTVED